MTVAESLGLPEDLAARLMRIGMALSNPASDRNAAGAVLRDERCRAALSALQDTSDAFCDALIETSDAITGVNADPRNLN
ncbi:MAG: hypothetical protein AAF822_03330 [Pseudomonadota bacterium]